MRSRNQSSNAVMWLALSTAGLLAATYLTRRNARRRARRVAESVMGAARGEEFLDDTIEESFPASDPPSWSSASASNPG